MKLITAYFLPTASNLLAQQCLLKNTTEIGAFPFCSFMKHFKVVVDKLGLFRYPPPPPVEAVAAATSVLTAATSVFTEYVCESVDSAHNSQISSTFQEADCLLKAS